MTSNKMIEKYWDKLIKMSEDKKPSENNVTYWSPPLPWLAPCVLKEENSKDTDREAPKQEETKAKD